MQYDEPRSARPGILRRQESSPAGQHGHTVAESRAAAERRRPYSSAEKAAGAAEEKRRSAAGKASSRDRTESEERPGPQIIASPRAERPEPSSRREPQTIPAASGSDPRQRERVRQSREERWERVRS